MNLDNIRRAVQIANGRVMLEVSGNVTLATIGDIARTGVDLISVGELTHSSPRRRFEHEDRSVLTGTPQTHRDGS